MLINHQDQQIVRRKTWNLELCFGTKVGTNQAKIEKISIFQTIWFEFLRSLVTSIQYEAKKFNWRREERPIGSHAVKMLRDLRCARAVSRGMWRRRTRAPKWEHVFTTGRYDVKDRRAQKVAWWLTRKRDLRAGNRPSKNQRVQGETSIVQSIQLDFLRSLGSATSNEANKSAMRRAEWTITARRAVLRLAQMKHRYFVPERCKQIAIFSDTSHPNR